MGKMTSVVAIMAVFTLAVCFVMIGAASVELQAKLDLTKAQVGQMMLCMSLIMIFTQLLTGAAVDKYGHKPLAILGFLTSSSSIFILAFAPSYSLAIVGAMLLGVGAIFCNTVGNTLLPVVLFEGKDPARASNFGNAFVGLGFALPPLLIGVLMTDVGLSYSATVSLIAALILVFTVFAIISSYPQVSTGFVLSKALGLLSKPLILVSALALVCYIGLEFTMNTWIKILMTELLGREAGAVRNAGLVLTGFALSMAIGRFITSKIKNLSSIGTKIIAVTALISIVTILLMSVTKNPIIAIIAVAITGLAFAPIFPTIIGVTFSKFDPSMYGSIFGIIFSVGLLGPTFLPYVIGKAGEQSIQKSMPIAAGVAVVLMIIAILMGKIMKSMDKDNKE